MAHFVGSKGANLVGLNVFQPTFTIVQTVCSHSFQFLLSQCPQTNNNGNTVAQAYMILIQVQNMFLPKKILTITLLAIKTILANYCFTGVSGEFHNGPFDSTILAQNSNPNI